MDQVTDTRVSFYLRLNRGCPFVSECLFVFRSNAIRESSLSDETA